MIVVASGAVASKLVSGKAEAPVLPAEGLVIGGLTGLLCGLVSQALLLCAGLVLDLSTRLRWLDSLPVGIGQRGLLDGQWLAASGWFCVSLVLHPVFGALGGAIGAGMTGGAGPTTWRANEPPSPSAARAGADNALE